MTFTDEEIELVVDHRMQEAIEAQHPPKNVTAWRRAARQQEIENEKAYPGFIARAAAGLRVRADGKRITNCRAVRGTHGMDYVWDPHGTETWPDGYSRDVAKANYDERQKRTRRVS